MATVGVKGLTVESYMPYGFRNAIVIDVGGSQQLAYECVLVEQLISP